MEALFTAPKTATFRGRPRPFLLLSRLVTKGRLRELRVAGVGAPVRLRPRPRWWVSRLSLLVSRGLSGKVLDTEASSCVSLGFEFRDELVRVGSEMV